MILRVVNQKRHSCASCLIIVIRGGAKVLYQQFLKIKTGRQKAVYTVEASVIMPIFLFICMAVFLFFRVLAVEWGVFVALTETVREAAVCGGEEAAAIGLAQVRIAGGGMPLSFVRHGALGMDFSQSEVTDKNVELVVSYSIPVPMDFFGLKKIRVTQRAKAHRWVGFDPKEGKGQGGELVYVTETGVAYHGSLKCSYLNPSIRTVSKNEIDQKRNASGHKYYPCPLCRGGSGVVFITTYGENYHGNIGCSGLKRTIRSITRDRAVEEGFHPCGKCGK